MLAIISWCWCWERQGSSNHLIFEVKASGLIFFWSSTADIIIWSIKKTTKVGGSDWYNYFVLFFCLTNHLDLSVNLFIFLDNKPLHVLRKKYILFESYIVFTAYDALLFYQWESDHSYKFWSCFNKLHLRSRSSLYYAALTWINSNMIVLRKNFSCSIQDLITKSDEKCRQVFPHS